MGKWLYISIMFICSFRIIAQDEEPAVIKVEKQSLLVKAVYDNDAYKLDCLDKYGNVVGHSIKYFELHYLEKKKKLKILKSTSEYLTPEMIDNFNKFKEAKKIFFTNILAEDSNGNTVRLPDVIEMQFPSNCKVKQDLRQK